MSFFPCHLTNSILSITIALNTTHSCTTTTHSTRLNCPKYCQRWRRPLCVVRVSRQVKQKPKTPKKQARCKAMSFVIFLAFKNTVHILPGHFTTWSYFSSCCCYWHTRRVMKSENERLKLKSHLAAKHHLHYIPYVFFSIFKYITSTPNSVIAFFSS